MEKAVHIWKFRYGKVKKFGLTVCEEDSDSNL